MYKQLRIESLVVVKQLTAPLPVAFFENRIQNGEEEEMSLDPKPKI